MNLDTAGAIMHVCLWLILGGIGAPGLMALFPLGGWARLLFAALAALCFLIYAPIAWLLFGGMLAETPLSDGAAFLLSLLLTPALYVGIAYASFRLVQKLSAEKVSPPAP